MEISEGQIKLREFKTELKAEADVLRKIKILIKITQRERKYAGTKQIQMLKLKRSYRHRHIAYCMLRGKEYKQIEQKCRQEPNHTLIGEIVNAYTCEEAVCAGA